VPPAVDSDAIVGQSITAARYRAREFPSPARDDMAMFDLDDFTASCAACLQEAEPRKAIKEVLARAIARPEEVADRLRPETAGITLLHHTPELTVIDVVWAPGMQIFAHDHRMWAAIGIYTGTEDNAFYRRTGDAPTGIEPSGGKRLQRGDVTLLGEHTVHSVSNPTREPTGAIHIYGGDFVNQPRSQWLAPERREEPFDSDRVTLEFATANAAWHGRAELPAD
jgi:predicted metal-dependent enzyme (double-stranded beta helix superfamily)